MLPELQRVWLRLLAKPFKDKPSDYENRWEQNWQPMMHYSTEDISLKDLSVRPLGNYPNGFRREAVLLNS